MGCDESNIELIPSLDEGEDLPKSVPMTLNPRKSNDYRLQYQKKGNVKPSK
jgi:hypothetical protein